MAEQIYVPRPWFTDFHKRSQRWAILVKHRRCGKTVAAVQDLIQKASWNPRPHPRYGYIAPLYNQAKQIAWTYLKEFAQDFRPKISESGLFVELAAIPSSPRITLYGADNPDAFRGLYFDGTVLDEFGNMRESVFTEVLLPTLMDRRGWCVFMGTPNGPNHFRDMWEKYGNDKNWFTSLSTVEDTKLISDDELAMMRTLMSEEEYEQEMMCSFAASARGAFYAREMKAALAEGRIGEFPADPYLPMHFSMDLGRRDDATLWGWQEPRDGIRIAHAESATGRGPAYFAERIAAACLAHRVQRGVLWLPHDARAKTFATERSAIEQFISLGIRPRIVPNLDVQDGIQAVRMLLPECRFNEDTTRDGIRALQSYRREYDEEKKVYRDQPLHDWSSHYGDGFRYLAIVAKKSRRTATKHDILAHIGKEAKQRPLYDFSLGELHNDRKAMMTRRVRL